MEKTENYTIKDIFKTPFEFMLAIYYTKTGVYRIDFLDQGEEKINTHSFKDITYRIMRYFNGEKVNFVDIPIILKNFNNFQLKVLYNCRQIPYGKLITYKDLAEIVQRPKAYRAVGNILGKNPIPVIIPCHRVIGSDGKLHGFRGGLNIKRALLYLEKSI